MNMNAQFNQDINNAIALADLYVRRSHLDCMPLARVETLSAPLKRLHPGDNLRMIHLLSITHEHGESLSSKIRNLFGAISSLDAGAFLLINGKREHVDLYLGVTTQEPGRAPLAWRTFLSTLTGTLPGSRYRSMKLGEVERVLADVFPEDEPLHMSAVSAFTSDRTEDAYDSVDKLDVLIDGMRRKPFSMLLLAQSVPQAELTAARQSLENLHTQISPLQKQDISISTSSNRSVGGSFTETVSQNISRSLSLSRNKSHSYGEGSSVQALPDNGPTAKNQAVKQLAGLGISVLMSNPSTALAAGSLSALLPSFFYGQSITNALNSLDQLTSDSSEDRQPVVTNTRHDDYSDGEGIQATQNTGESTSAANGISVTTGTTDGETRQYSVTNRSVSGLLENLNRQIERIDAFKTEGAYRLAAYFVAGDAETAISAANLYRAISTASRSPILESPIYHWRDPEEVGALMNYLRRGAHPVFSFENDPGFPSFEIAQDVGLHDMPAYFALPKNSVPGFVVSQSARFARDIVRPTGGAQARSDRSVSIGCVYHLGREEHHTPIHLDMDHLTKHMFVAGATGVGKSNFCYQLLDQLDRKGVRMLIVEPAKGEYARVLGGRPGFSVYGVDPRTAPVLRINPFAFPDGIPVVQHIERLMDIFNAAWPMYSAMPAILKESIEEIYIEKGFDLLSGARPAGAQFPCFAELLAMLPKIIDRSAYSGEVKGNYIGALVTRVRSLTNGLYGVMFGRDEIPDHRLFDENVIVDISRVGSAETKALLMGVMILRLNEYRMCSGDMNMPLQHVTLLEEAHHLLRRQNPGGPEGANIRAASVEMITNAIAEMRTYGEGFIIADQSPGVMDLSAIRNTQTKVFFMLPESDDRAVAGNSLSLRPDQQQELARLTTGVAAVYQNSWTDAVLCKVNYFTPDRARPFIFDASAHEDRFGELVTQCTAALLRRRLPVGTPSSADDDLIRALLKGDYPLHREHEAVAKAALQQYLSGETAPDALHRDVDVLNRLVGLNRILQSGSNLPGIDAWAEHVEHSLGLRVKLPTAEIRAAIMLGLKEWTQRDGRARSLYAAYLNHTLNHPTD